MPEATDPLNAFSRLLETVHRLRRECPWDREQTSKSILPYLIEEAYEAFEAIEHEKPEDVRGELGDLLLQILLHAEIASERGEFDAAGVIEAVNEKMIRRHPHVFGETRVEGTGEVLRNWARIKAEERRARAEDHSAIAGIPASLPALLRAERTGEKASRVGFDWPDARSALDKVCEEVREIEGALAAGDPAELEAEIGDALFALASLARKAGISAEIALGRTLERFGRRFRAVEHELESRGRSAADASPDELESLWQAAKRSTSR